MKKRKGSTLIMVICIFAVLFIAGTAVTVITANNALATRMQRQRVQAYYLVWSGLDLGTSALLTEFVEPGMATPTRLLAKFEAGELTGERTETIQVCDCDEGNTGHDGAHEEIEIRLRAVDSDWEPIIGVPTVNQQVWVEVFAVGTLTPPTGEPTSHAGRLLIKCSNPAQQVRELEDPLDF